MEGCIVSPFLFVLYENELIRVCKELPGIKILFSGPKCVFYKNIIDFCLAKSLNIYYKIKLALTYNLGGEAHIGI